MTTRTFKYQDQSWPDPGADFSIEDVRRHLTQYFPELAQATTQEKKLESGDVEITFVKKAGTKGGEEPPIWGARVLAERLAHTPPLRLRAIEVLAELQGEVSVARFIELQPELEQAELQISQHVQRVSRMARTLTTLRAVPSRHTPAGF